MLSLRLHCQTLLLKAGAMAVFHTVLVYEVSDNVDKRLYLIHLGSEIANCHTPDPWPSGINRLGD